MMKLRILALTVICAGTLAAQRFLTNDDIVKMVGSGVAQDIIIRMISESSVQFSLAPDNLIGFKKAGVPDDVVRAMITRTREIDQNRAAPPVPATTPELTGSQPVKDGANPIRAALPESTVKPIPADSPIAQFEVGQLVRPAAKVTPVQHNVGAEAYGLQLGSVVGFGGAGFGYDTEGTGVFPTFGGGFEVGLHRYFGVFWDGTYTRLVNDGVAVCTNVACISGDVKASAIVFSGGLEVVGTNRSRVVPYAKVGMGYGREWASIFGVGFFGDSISAPAIAFGGGVHIYITQHFGIESQVLGYRFFHNGGGSTAIIPTFGVFAQSK